MGAISIPCSKIDLGVRFPPRHLETSRFRGFVMCKHLEGSCATLGATWGNFGSNFHKHMEDNCWAWTPKVACRRRVVCVMHTMLLCVRPKWVHKQDILIQEKTNRRAAPTVFGVMLGQLGARVMHRIYAFPDGLGGRAGKVSPPSKPWFGCFGGTCERPSCPDVSTGLTVVPLS